MFNPESPPDITASRWLNSERARSLKAEKGKVVVVAIAQILCPGSQKYGLPQAMRLRGAFSEREVTVFGLHMTFEQFAAQTPDKVQAYLNEHEITIPVAYDQPNGEDEPQTMVEYSLQGTPAILVFDRQGRLRRHYLGAVDDLRLGAEVMALLIEDETSPREMSIALERKMAMALVDPDAHEHEGGCCGGHHHDHDHGHDHDHDHDHHHHAHGEGGCCGGGGGCGGEGKGRCKDEHGHAHDHWHDHDHDHDHASAHHAHGGGGGCGGSGQCGCGAKDDAKA